MFADQTVLKDLPVRAFFSLHFFLERSTEKFDFRTPSR